MTVDCHRDWLGSGRVLHLLQHPVTRLLMMFLEIKIVEISFRVSDHYQIHFFVFVTDLQRRLFIELWQFGPCAGHCNFHFVIVRCD